MRRIAELDVMRGIAALVIVVYHLGLLSAYPVLTTAVDLFFVLSGYLITTILLNTERTPRALGSFYLRRAMRIWPIYYLGLAIALFLNALQRPSAPLDALPYFLTYTQFIAQYVFGVFQPFTPLTYHTWTLAIEEQFYIFWPIVVFWTGRRRLSWMLGPLLLLPFSMRVAGFEPAILPSRCDGLLLGALLALILIDGPGPRPRRVRLTVAFGLLALGMLASPLWMKPVLRASHHIFPASAWFRIALSLTVSRLCLLYYAVVGLVIMYAGKPFLAPLRSRVLCYLGRISYGLYLYHPFAFTAVWLVEQRLGLPTTPLFVAVRLAVSITMAVVSWHLIERPILAWRERLTAPTSTSIAAISALFRGPHTRVEIPSISHETRTEKSELIDGG
jgi:peptidoglycan/LPS O-acetylase OafA/YrhL